MSNVFYVDLEGDHMVMADHEKGVAAWFSLSRVIVSGINAFVHRHLDVNVFEYATNTFDKNNVPKNLERVC
ncbi:hypothetical protein Arno162_36 [Pectobacterium phage Arno162]|uniref:Uncharacterized protein n=1 Tax=Pectobacterium phage Arno162 TaxID=2500577 RepID=A0A678ZZ55_9CAUD|nr:hypothetical protein Arno162_36 [Pectobacterium phage Arno162]